MFIVKGGFGNHIDPTVGVEFGVGDELLEGVVGEHTSQVKLLGLSKHEKIRSVFHASKEIKVGG